MKKLLATLCGLLSIGTTSATPSDAATMQELRLALISTPASEISIAPSREFPLVYGVVMDWPIGSTIASVVGMSDGSGSLYTTSTFGIIGGARVERVSRAAKQLAKVAQSFRGEAMPTRDFALPRMGRIRFYLLCFDGTRLIETDFVPVASNKSKYSPLFAAGQEVLTQLRATVESKK